MPVTDAAVAKVVGAPVCVSFDNDSWGGRMSHKRPGSLRRRKGQGLTAIIIQVRVAQRLLQLHLSLHLDLQSSTSVLATSRSNTLATLPILGINVISL